MKTRFKLLPLMLLLALPAAVQAQFTYTTNNGTITITHCSSAGAVTFPSAIDGLPVTAIAAGVFPGGPWTVTDVTVPASVTNIDARAFRYVATAIMVDPSNPVYGSSDGVLFDRNQATLIQLPNGKSGSYAIPNTVSTVEPWAVDICHLASVAIPSSVTNLGSTPFRYCPSLTAITVDPLNSFYSSLDGVLFDKSQSSLIKYPSHKAGNYIMPESTLTIEDDAFYECSYLSNITVGNNVTNIGYEAFSGCGLLGGITIPDKVATLGPGAFSQCYELGSLTIGKSVTSIGASTFSSSGLHRLTIPGSVTNLESQAFGNCYNLSEVYFQGNAPAASPFAFIGNTSAIVYYLPGTTNWGQALGGLLALQWNPQVEITDGSFGVRTNCFGFNITSTNYISIVVEACTNLANGIWIPLRSYTVPGGSVYFNDPQWTNYPARLYRLRSP